MKKLYYDKTENTDCVSIFVKDAEVIPAGTTVSSMSIKNKNKEYQKFSEEYDINFIFDDNIPEIDFYAVPQVDVFAFDSKGGFFAAVGGITDLDGTEPVCYIDNNRKCFIIADSMRSFLKLASCWQKNMVPDEEITFFSTKKEAAPPKGLEMSVVLDKYCNPFVYPTPFELHFSNMHKESCRNNLKKYCQEMYGTDKDLAAHFTVILAVGRVLCGEDIPAVFGKVPRENYLDSIRSDIENAADEIRENPVYFILNLCRVLVFMEEDTVVSKEQGGKWALRRLPELYHPVIKKALRNYFGSGAFRAEERELKEFAEYMLGEIQAVSRS